jgi:hypothetical protein
MSASRNTASGVSPNAKQANKSGLSAIRPLSSSLRNLKLNVFDLPPDYSIRNVRLIYDYVLISMLFEEHAQT